MIKELIAEFKVNNRRIEKAESYFNRDDIAYSEKIKFYDKYRALLRQQGLLQAELNSKGVDVSG